MPNILDDIRHNLGVKSVDLPSAMDFVSLQLQPQDLMSNNVEMEPCKVTATSKVSKGTKRGFSCLQDELDIDDSYTTGISTPPNNAPNSSLFFGTSLPVQPSRPLYPDSGYGSLRPSPSGSPSKRLLSTGPESQDRDGRKRFTWRRLGAPDLVGSIAHDGNNGSKEKEGKESD